MIKFKKKILFVFILLIVNVSCTNHFSRNSNCQKTDFVNKKEWLKDYALCRCIYEGFKRDSLLRKDASLSVLHEISDFQPKVYDSIDAMSVRFTRLIKPLSIGDYGERKAIILNCIEFSKALCIDSLINKNQ